MGYVQKYRAEVFETAIPGSWTGDNRIPPPGLLVRHDLRVFFSSDVESALRINMTLQRQSRREQQLRGVRFYIAIRFDGCRRGGRGLRHFRGLSKGSVVPVPCKLVSLPHERNRFYKLPMRGSSNFTRQIGQGRNSFALAPVVKCGVPLLFTIILVAVLVRFRRARSHN